MVAKKACQNHSGGDTGQSRADAPVSRLGADKSLGNKD